MVKSRFIIIGAVILIASGLIIFVPPARIIFSVGWDWVFGSPKALEAGFYYTCAMHPAIRLQGPGDCPICGMSLVKREAGREEDISAGITLSERQIQIGGIRMEKIKRRDLVKVVEAVGKIDYDERSLYQVSARIDGRIDKLHVNFTGATIQSNHALVWLYSPQLVSAQKEYLLTLDTFKVIKSGQFQETVKPAEELVESTKRRLLLWGITEEQVVELEKNRKVTDHFTIYTTQGGTVIKKNVIEGMYVKEGDVLFEIADLSNVWLYADIYESDIPLLMEPYEDDYYQCPMHPEIKQNDPGLCSIKGCQMPLIRYSPSLTSEVTTKSFPGESFTCKIEYAYPFVNPETRTLRVRITIPNLELKLRPEMYARAQIKIAKENILSIPESAVIYTGKRNIVFVDQGKGQLNPRTVALGAQWLYHKDFVSSEEKGLPFHRGMQRYHEVREGVQEDEIVVTSGNFLVDAESQIQGALEKFLESGQTGEPKDLKDKMGDLKKDDFAVCAWEGMEMKLSAFQSKMEYEGETLYFCTEEEMKKFMDNSQESSYYKQKHKGHIK
ncbi:MAG: efflux RND transporter periplasmic adaptor subunit [Planctomycetota bacterium]